MENNDNQNSYINSSETARILGITTQTVRLWDKQGKINSVRNPSNRRLYDKQAIFDLAGWNLPSPEKEKIIYARVSSKKQMDDLERQKNFLHSEFPTHTMVSDVGSGLNWRRKGLQTILERALSGKLEEVVVSHRDRLCRFAFELLESVFKSCGVRLVVLDHGGDSPESTEQELANDILSIIQVYSCRAMGRRRYKRREEAQSEEDSLIPNPIPSENA